MDELNEQSHHKNMHSLKCREMPFIAFDPYILQRKSYAARLITLHSFIVFLQKKIKVKLSLYMPCGNMGDITGIAPFILKLITR